MFGHYSYLISILIFAGTAVLVEWISGFYFFKKYVKSILVTLILGLVITPLGEGRALLMGNWVYSSEKILNIFFLGAAIETYIFVIFVGVAVSSAVLVWTFYEDNEKPILRQSLKDIVNGTYAIWGKEKKVFKKKKKANKLKKCF